MYCGFREKKYLSCFVCERNYEIKISHVLYYLKFDLKKKTNNGVKTNSLLFQTLKSVVVDSRDQNRH